MKMNLAYATIVGTALMASAALAEDAAKPPADQSAQTQTAPSEGQFVTTQGVDEWRAPKLIGVDVYGPDNKKVGSIKDILLSHDGSAKAVVIEVGGFLGIGAKNVAVPFQSIQWKMEPRGAANADNGSGNSMNSAGGAGTSANNAGTSANNAGTSASNMAPKTNPVEAEASQGYPDRAMINMTQAQLKSAPEFQYASNMTDQNGGSKQSASQQQQNQQQLQQQTKP